jgi:hypothetical protein
MTLTAAGWIVAAAVLAVGGLLAWRMEGRGRWVLGAVTVLIAAGVGWLAWLAGTAA